MTLIYDKMDTPEKFMLALQVQHELFPDEDQADKDYREKMEYLDCDDFVSWLVYDDDKLIGLTGVFAFDDDEAGYDDGKSIWMDWFGVLKEYRRRGYGREILNWTIEYCRKLGRFKFFRLDTEFWEGRPALKLYDDVMDCRETYTAEDPEGGSYNWLIYSKCLGDDELELWNNHNLDLVKNYEM